MFSVIVPIYNSEKYLGSCIASILDQTFQDFELILVDDSSTDTSLSICNEYAKKDQRIIVVCQNKNEGVSSARNAGLQIASRPYIVFCDSDDLLDRDFLKTLTNPLDDEDLVFLGIKIISTSGNFIKQYQASSDYTGQCNNEILKKIINDKIFASACAKRLKTSIIKKNNIRFKRDINFGEDTLFVSEYLIHCSTIRVVPKSCYYYRIHNSSHLNEIRTLKEFNAFNQTNDLIEHTLEELYHGITKTSEWKKRIYSIIFNYLFKVLKNDKIPNIEKVRSLRVIFKHKNYPRRYSEVKNSLSSEGNSLIFSLWIRSSIATLFIFYCAILKEKLTRNFIYRKK